MKSHQTKQTIKKKTLQNLDISPYNLKYGAGLKNNKCTKFLESQTPSQCQQCS